MEGPLLASELAWLMQMGSVGAKVDDDVKVPATRLAVGSNLVHRGRINLLANEGKLRLLALGVEPVSAVAAGHGGDGRLARVVWRRGAREEVSPGAFLVARVVGEEVVEQARRRLAYACDVSMQRVMGDDAAAVPGAMAAAACGEQQCGACGTGPVGDTRGRGGTNSARQPLPEWRGSSQAKLDNMGVQVRVGLCWCSGAVERLEDEYQA